MEKSLKSKEKTKKSVRIFKFFTSIYTFYRDGFRSMVVGKQLWKIIFIKLLVMFAILKLFFFPNYLNTKFQTKEEKSNYVLEQIIKKASLNSEDSFSQKNLTEKEENK